MQAASSQPVSWTFKSFLKQCENAILSCMLRRVPCSEPFFSQALKPDWRSRLISAVADVHRQL
jgi:hypothetical protein